MFDSAHVLIIFLLFIIIGLLIYIAFFKKDTTSSTSSKLQLVNSSAKNDNITLYGLDNKPKDWVFILKLGTGGDNCTKSGSKYSCKYLYCDNENPSLQLINTNIDDKSGPLYNTWKQCQNTSNGYISWNDESSIINSNPASGSSSEPISAHDKGWIIYDNNGGIYCQHSCPNWPYPGRDDDSFLSTTYKSAPGIMTNLSQHFLLLNMSSTDINNMAKILENASVDYYVAQIPSGSSSNVSELNNFVNNINNNYNDYSLYNRCSNYKGLQSFSTTIGNTPVIIYGKSGCEMDDMYNIFSKNNCNNDMTVWTYCTPVCYKTDENVKDFNYSENKKANGSNWGATDWTSNHAKLGVCSEGNLAWIGGNNHSASQAHRGGIFVQMQDQTLADNIRKLLRM